MTTSNNKDSTLTKHCLICDTEFLKKPSHSRTAWANAKFCSKRCANSRPLTTEGPVIEGITHGTITGYSDHTCRCFECRAAARKYRQRSRDGILIPKEERAFSGLIGERHPQWQGDDASEYAKYMRVHRWVYRHKDRTHVCSKCGKEGRTQWANTDHQYRYGLADFIELCSSCHKIHDLDLKRVS
jgi:hypothetical protein